MLLRTVTTVNLQLNLLLVASLYCLVWTSSAQCGCEIDSSCNCHDAVEYLQCVDECDSGSFSSQCESVASQCTELHFNCESANAQGVLSCSSSSISVGSVGGIIVALLVGCGLLCCLCQRRSSNNKNNNNTSNGASYQLMK